jgi:hypothetical protein
LKRTPQLRCEKYPPNHAFCRRKNHPFFLRLRRKNFVEGGANRDICEDSPVAFEDTITGYLAFPGFEGDDRWIRVIGTDKFRTAPESLEPDRIPATDLTLHAFSHGDRLLLFSPQRFFPRATSSSPGPFHEDTFVKKYLTGTGSVKKISCCFQQGITGLF